MEHLQKCHKHHILGLRTGLSWHTRSGCVPDVQHSELASGPAVLSPTSAAAATLHASQQGLPHHHAAATSPMPSPFAAATTVTIKSEGLAQASMPSTSTTACCFCTNTQRVALGCKAYWWTNEGRSPPLQALWVLHVSAGHLPYQVGSQERLW